MDSSAPVCTLSELRSRGVKIAIYSTPCLFAAQTAMEQALKTLKAEDGSLVSALERDATLAGCNDLLRHNLNQSKGGQFEDLH